jgi:hypothetical protein
MTEKSDPVFLLSPIADLRPLPLPRRSPFIRSKPFSKANGLLRGADPGGIDWNLAKRRARPSFAMALPGRAHLSELRLENSEGSAFCNGCAAALAAELVREVLLAHGR